MKKLIVPAALVLVIGLGSYALFAQHEQAPDRSQSGMMGNMGCSGCAMMPGTLAATTDGGVVVVTGSKLVKYDAALKKVAETELETNGNATPQAMQSCPMMNMMK